MIRRPGLIHISSPPQASHSPIEADLKAENVSEKGPGGESVKEGAQNKNKLGIFAKLLDGLVSKGKKEAPEAVAAEISEKNLELANELSRKAGNPLEGGEFAFKANLEAKSVIEEGLSPKGEAYLRQGSGESEGSFLRAGEVISRENSLGDFRARENHPRDILSRDLVPDVEHSPREGELSLRANLDAALEEAAALEKNEFSPGEKAKNAGREAANYLSFSFREKDGQRQQPLELSRVEGGLKENSLLQENRDRKSRPLIEVRDLRTHRAQETSMSDLSKGQGFSGQAAVEGSGSEGRGNLLNIDLDLSLGKGEPLSNALGKNGVEAGQSRFLEDALARELRGNLSNDIVRNAMVIVRDGNEGTIRLSLRPASLGDVKIRLEMVENKITGFIILESNEALRAFERELPVLEKAFRDSGFSETSLSLSLAQEGWSSGAQEEQLRGEFEALSRAFAASRYEAENEGPQALPNTGVDASGERALPAGMPGRVPVNLLV